MPFDPFSSSVMDDNSTHILGLSPLSVAIIGIISAATVLLTYHCLIPWCNRREFVPHRRHPRLFAANLEDTPNRVENSIVELIPSYKYSKDIGMVSKTQDGTCAVCLCEFVEGEPVRVLPDCLHPFHVPCIDMWLLSHSNCPICRTDTTRLPLRHQLEPDAGALRSDEQLL